MKLKLLRLFIMTIKLSTYGLAFQVLFMSVLYAHSGIGQYKKTSDVFIDQAINGLTIKEAFELIERESELEISYLKKDLKQKVRIYLNSSKSMSVHDILMEISKQSGLKFRQINNGITVFPISDKEFQNEIDRIEVLEKVGISGKITDEKGQGLPGASIVEKGTTNGSTSDVDGNYKLSVTENATLIVSFVGYQTQEVIIGRQSIIDLQLVLDATQLENIVVVGYGTQDKNHVAGAIVHVDAQELNDQPVANIDQALVGKMAGVQVIQATGEPGVAAQFRVRRTSSATAGNEPLYVLDGMPLDRGIQVFEVLSSNDIESIQVLKDASSAAIYGSRGSNGVVLITTKNGRSDGLQVSYNGNVGFQKVSKKINMLDGYEWVDMLNDAHTNAYLDQVPGASASDPYNIRPQGYHKVPDALIPYLNGQLGLPNLDYQDEIFQTASVSNHNLSFSGKGGLVSYYISGFHNKQEGIIINSDYEKTGFRVNVNVDQNKLKIGLSLAPSYSVNNQVQAYGPFTSEGVVTSALSLQPVFPLYNSDGSYNWDGNGIFRIGTDHQIAGVLNPVAMANEIDNRTTHVNLLSTTFLEYEFLKGLDYRVMFGSSQNNYKNNYYRPSTLPLRGWRFLDAPSNPTARSSSTSLVNWLIENTLNYSFDISSHSFNSIIGFSRQKERADFESVTATNFPNDLIRTVNGGEVIDGTSSVNEWSLASWFGRIQYNFKERYFVNVSARTDGSSRFGINNRWGFFPAISGGWIMTNEPFMQNKIDWMSFTKIRASYGLTGNYQIGNYDHLARLSPTNYILGGAQGSTASGLSSISMDNPELGWEKTATLNLGVELGLFDDKLKFYFDWYSANTSDILLEVPVPLITGFETSLQNIGKVNNKGWEFAAESRQDIGELQWILKANLSVNKNEIKELGPNNTEIIKTVGTTGNDYITRIGESMGSYYLLKTNGIFQNQNELDAYPHFSNSHPGDYIFIDTNSDGILDVNDDRQIVGSYVPDFTYGIYSSFKFIGLDLSFNFQGVEGVEVMNLGQRHFNANNGAFNNYAAGLNRWKSESEPGDGLTTRANRKPTGNNGRPNSSWVEDGSYLRLQSLTIGYSLPKGFINSLHLENLRFYASAQNLFTLTDYNGYNPEVSNYNEDSLTPGTDYGSYPLAKSISIGVNVQF